MSDTLDINDDAMLWLNTVTGRVHRHKGIMPGGIPPKDADNDSFGVVPCGCSGDDGEHFEEAARNDTMQAIRGRHLKVGIWEPAPCVLGDEGSESSESSESGESNDKPDGYTMIEDSETKREAYPDEEDAPGIEW